MTSSNQLKNYLFIKKIHHDPELIKIPEECGTVLSAHPYKNDYFVLTSKHTILRIRGLHDNDPHCKIQEFTLSPYDDFTKIYLKEPYEHVRVEGLDKSFFLQSNRSLWRVVAIEGDTFHTTKIYSVTPQLKILNIRFLEDNITIYLSDYSFVDITFHSYDFQSYAHIGARITVGASA